jgi:hypothetical protein
MNRNLLALLILLIASLACGSSSPTLDTPEDYVDAYGGNVDVYRNLLTLTDCTTLQTEFDIAAENNERETAGTPQHRATLGYMTAADARMKALGCYGSSDSGQNVLRASTDTVAPVLNIESPTAFILPTLTQPATQIPSPTAQPTATLLFIFTAPASGGGGAVCPCGGDTLNCSDFTSSSNAQACMDYCISQGAGDIHNLDGNANGQACET